MQSRTYCAPVHSITQLPKGTGGWKLPVLMQAGGIFRHAPSTLHCRSIRFRWSRGGKIPLGKEDFHSMKTSPCQALQRKFHRLGEKGEHGARSGETHVPAPM